jgi:hypothetical protein
MAIIFDEGINVDFTNGTFFSENKEYNLSTFFNPIDNIYGPFKPHRDVNSEQNRKQIDEDKNFKSNEDFKQQWYLREGFFNGGIPNLAAEPYKGKIENHKVIKIAFEIIKDSGPSIQKYNFKVYYLKEDDNIELMESSNPILVIPKQTLIDNVNYRNEELFLRLGNYCESNDANRFVIFFHGRTESNCPGRIPSE